MSAKELDYLQNTLNSRINNMKELQEAIAYFKANLPEYLLKKLQYAGAAKCSFL